MVGRGTRATDVLITELRCPWLLIGAAPADLRDKLVMLAVCGGHCPDTIWTFVRDDHLALFLVASPTSVAAADVLAVFPPFLEQFKTSTEMTPEDAQRVLEQVQGKRGKFRFVSGVSVLKT